MSDRLTVPSDRDASGRSFGPEELDLLRQVIASGSLNSNSGRFVTRFEQAFAARLGVAHCVACSSGSLAVQAAVFALGAPRGSAIVTSPITDFGALTAILYEGHRLRFCDVDPCTLAPTAATIEAALEADGGCGGVVLTPLFGRPAPAAAVREVCARHRVPLIEDAAQALGAGHQGRPPGTFGDLGTFSFQQSKHISAGEGGAVVTGDAALARRVRLFVNKAWPYGEPDADHLFRAPNGRLTELQAAVLLAQLDKLDGFVAARQASAAALCAALSGGVELVPPAKGDRHSFWRVDLRLRRPAIGAELGRRLRELGIPSQPHYIGRPAFELRALRELGHRERREEFPGVRQGLEQALILPWNERIDVELAGAIGERVARTARDLEAAT